MARLPKAVSDRLSTLRKEHPHYIELKIVGKHFYVYEATTKWDRERRKRIRLANYIGRIRENGSFVVAAKRAKPIDLDAPLQTAGMAENVMKAESVKTERTIAPITSSSNLNETDKHILTALSMNGRIPVRVLGKIVDMKETAASHRLKKLEKRYDIRYFADIAFWKFGLNQFIGFIKFKDEIPPVEEIRQTLSKEPHVQMAALTSGEYDVVFYFLAESNDEATDIAYKLQTETRLSNYDAKWNVSYFYQNYGAIPVRPEFFELLEGRVWHKTKEEPTRKRNDLWRREYVVLKELCRDGAVSFAEIDRRNNLESGSAQYTFAKLKESGIIRRVTCTMQKLSFMHNAIVLADITRGDEFVRTRNAYLSEMIETTNHPVNKYVLTGSMTAPNALVMISPIFDEEEFERLSGLSSHVLGIHMNMLIMSSILVGSLCYRLFDNEHSSQWEILAQNGVVKTKQRVNYDETGRVKKKHIRIEKELGTYGLKYE